MEHRQITPKFSVSKQLRVEDLREVATLGFKTIINNRPDQEDVEQPASSTMAAAASTAKLKYYHLPVVSGNITDVEVEQFATLLAKTPGPVLAFCRTGTRSSILWALSQAGHLSTQEILSQCLAAGYDLDKLKPRLEARAKN